MRVRTLAGAVVAALTLTLLAASPASAAGESVGGCVLEEVHALEEAIAEGADIDEKELEEKAGEAIEDCQEAPNPILPEVNEIIWGGLAFLILVGLMLWKGVPLVRGAMDARAQKIRDDLDAADRSKQAAAEVQAEYEAKLADAKAEASRLVDEARRDADQVRADLQARAETEVAEMKARAATDIETAKAQALADLRNDVSAIALGAAERVVGASLDPSTHAQLIDSYISEVASN